VYEPRKQKMLHIKETLKDFQQSSLASFIPDPSEQLSTVQVCIFDAMVIDFPVDLKALIT